VDNFCRRKAVEEGGGGVGIGADVLGIDQVVDFEVGEEFGL